MLSPRSDRHHWLRPVWVLVASVIGSAGAVPARPTGLLSRAAIVVLTRDWYQEATQYAWAGQRALVAEVDSADTTRYPFGYYLGVVDAWSGERRPLSGVAAAYTGGGAVEDMWALSPDGHRLLWATGDAERYVWITSLLDGSQRRTWAAAVHVGSSVRDGGCFWMAGGGAWAEWVSDGSGCRFAVHSLATGRVNVGRCAGAARALGGTATGSLVLTGDLAEGGRISVYTWPGAGRGAMPLARRVRMPFGTICVPEVALSPSGASMAWLVLGAPSRPRSRAVDPFAGDEVVGLLCTSRTDGSLFRTVGRMLLPHTASGQALYEAQQSGEVPRILRWLPAGPAGREDQVSFLYGGALYQVDVSSSERVGVASDTRWRPARRPVLGGIRHVPARNRLRRRRNLPSQRRVELL